MKGINKKDLKLLAALDKNSRKSFSKISKEIRMSQQLISYKVKKFLEEEVVQDFYTIFDYSRFGYLQFRVYFKTNYISKDSFKKLIVFFVEHPLTLSVIECHGKWDLIVTFAAKNASHFNKELKDIMYSNPKQLRNYTILTTVVMHEFTRKYLVPQKKDIDIIVGGDREIVIFDEIDEKIMKELHNDARQGSVKIANIIEVSPKTVVSRIKKLEKSEIIRGYSVLINPRKMGFSLKRVLLRYDNLSVEKERSLIRYCEMNENIVGVVKVFGEWDLEIDIETETLEEFRNVYVDIREKFQDIINDFEDVSVFKVYKKDFLPLEYFNKSVS